MSIRIAESTNTAPARFLGFAIACGARVDDLREWEVLLEVHSELVDRWHVPPHRELPRSPRVAGGGLVQSSFFLRPRQKVRGIVMALSGAVSFVLNFRTWARQSMR